MCVRIFFLKIHWVLPKYLENSATRPFTKKASTASMDPRFLLNFEFWITRPPTQKKLILLWFYALFSQYFMLFYANIGNILCYFMPMLAFILCFFTPMFIIYCQNLDMRPSSDLPLIEHKKELGKGPFWRKIRTY